MDLATFRGLYPEFAQATDNNITAKLEEAARRISPTVWQNLTEDGIGLLTAALLAGSPYGAQMRLRSDPAQNTYLQRFEELSSMVALGPFVAGGTYL